MLEPTTLAEFNDRFWANHVITGFGTDVSTHMPCPFCAAPDFLVVPVLGVTEAMRDEQTCTACGRSGVHLFEYPDPDTIKFEFVQTGGDDPPPWLLPKPRRVTRP